MTLWNGLCRYLLDVDGWDKAYVAQHVSGFEALAAALDDPALATGRGGPQLRPHAQRSARFHYQLFAHPRTVTLFCQGINQSTRGGQGQRSSLNAHLMCGRIGKPGRLPSP